MGDRFGVMWLLWWALGWLWGAFRATVGSLGPLSGLPLGPVGQPRGALGSHLFGFVGPKVYTNRDGTLTSFRYRCLGTFLTLPWSETCIFQGSEPLVCMRRAIVFDLARGSRPLPWSVLHRGAAFAGQCDTDVTGSCSNLTSVIPPFRIVRGCPPWTLE